MLLSHVTVHKITTFRCKYLATMVTGGNDDNDDKDSTTMKTMMMTATSPQATGYNDDGGGL